MAENWRRIARPEAVERRIRSEYEGAGGGG